MLSKQFSRGERNKQKANQMLREKYGTSGSSNRLFKKSKEYKNTQSATRNSMKNNAMIEGWTSSFNDNDRYSHKATSYQSPQVFGRDSLNDNSSVQQQRLHSGRAFKMQNRRKRPGSAVVSLGPHSAYLESQNVPVKPPSTSSRVKQSIHNSAGISTAGST